MIEPKLSGRLGNFMFEVATAYAYSLRHNMDWNVSPIGGGVENESIAKYLSWFPNIKTGNRIQEPYYIYDEAGRHEFNAIPLHKNILIDGYFQSEKYFDDYKKEVFNLFNFPYEKREGWTSIHVRRGDYVTFFTRFPPVDLRYLTPAMRLMAANHFSKFLVFSDDIAWCKQNLNSYKYPEYTFDYSEGRNEYEDMVLGASCEHNIICNSTFSWWQAWMNPNQNKIVISPSKEPGCWFGSRVTLNTKDLIPKEWVQIRF